MKIIVEAPLSTFSGYGNDGIGMIMALVQMGHDVYLEPKVVQPPLPTEVAELLTKPLASPFDLAIHHVDPGQLGFEQPEAPAKAQAAEVNVGWTMWEYSTLDNLPGRSLVRDRWKYFDAILCYDDVTAGALDPRVGRYVDVTKDEQGYLHQTTTKEEVKFPVLQGGYWPSRWPHVDRDWFGDRFGFCMIGMLHERKDPFTAINAFAELKREKGAEFEGAELHLKTQSPGLHPQMEKIYPKVRVHYVNWTTDKLRAFMSFQHCLLAPSRGEGKNMPALEFMSTGGTAIATAWGGHTQWLNPEYSLGIDYTLAPVSGGKYPNCMNARASKDHLKELMWRVYSDRQYAKKLGDNAARAIPNSHSWTNVMERFFLRLKDEITFKDKGRALYEKHVATKSEAQRESEWQRQTPVSY